MGLILDARSVHTPIFRIRSWRCIGLHAWSNRPDSKPATRSYDEIHEIESSTEAV